MFMDQTDHLLAYHPTYVILALMYCIEEATSRIMELILSNLFLEVVSQPEGSYDLCKNTTIS